MKNLSFVGKENKERENLKDLCVHGRIILKWILKRWFGRVWTGFIWLRIGISSWPL
jgi:hypothetical protein